MTELSGAEQNRFLTGDNAARTDVNQAWEQDNKRGGIGMSRWRTTKMAK